MAPNSTTLGHRPVGDNSKTLLYVLAFVGILAIAIAVGIFLNSHVLEPGAQATKDAVEQVKETVRGATRKPKEMIGDTEALAAVRKRLLELHQPVPKMHIADSVKGLRVIKGGYYKNYLKSEDEKRIVALETAAGPVAVFVVRGKFKNPYTGVTNTIWVPVQ